VRSVCMWGWLPLEAVLCVRWWRGGGAGRGLRRGGLPCRGWLTGRL
jgi:hypothetical protein